MHCFLSTKRNSNTSNGTCYCLPFTDGIIAENFEEVNKCSAANPGIKERADGRIVPRFQGTTRLALHGENWNYFKHHWFNLLQTF